MKRLSYILLFVATVISVAAQVPEGAKPGLFTVNDEGKQVFFSQGDLMYKGVWRFADELNETREVDNTFASFRNISPYWFTLFGWGTSGYSTTQNQMPYDITTFNTIYKLHVGSYGPYDSSLNEAGDNPNYDNREFDWAWHNKIENGGNAEHQWRTLTADEWKYVLTERENAYHLRFFVGIKDADGIHETGLMLLPDNWSRTDLFDWDYFYNNAELAELVGQSYDPQDYLPLSFSRVEQICKAGGVLLKLSGARYRTNVNWNYAAAYWTATGVKNDTDYGMVNTEAYCLFFAASANNINNPIGMIGYLDYNDYEETPIGKYQRPGIALATAPLYYGMKVRAVQDKPDMYGKHFVNLNTNNDYTYFLVDGKTYSQGSVVVNHGETITIEVITTNADYRFKSWASSFLSSTDNPVTITVNEDMLLNAYIEQVPKYVIEAKPTNMAAGIVTGGGIYKDGTQITLTAVANDGYEFVKWLDGRNGEEGPRNNPRTIVVSEDMSYWAVFAEKTKYDVIVQSNDPSLGTVTGGGTGLEPYSEITLKATPKQGCEFLYWKPESGYMRTNPELTWTVTGNETITAYFRVKPEYTEYNLYVCGTQVTSANQGDILGDGVFAYDPDNHVLSTMNGASYYSSDVYNIVNNVFISDWRALDGVTKPLTLLLNHSVGVKAASNDGTSRALIYAPNGIEMEGNQYAYFIAEVSDMYVASTGHLTIRGGMGFEAVFKGYSDKLKAAVLLSGSTSYIEVIGSSMEINAKGNYGGKDYPVCNYTSASNLKLTRAEVKVGSLAETLIRIADLSYYYSIGYSVEAGDALLLCPVEGFGWYQEQTVVTITAKPTVGYEFVRWSDGNNTNPRKITMNRDYELDPVIRPVGIDSPGAFVNAISDDPTMGTIKEFTAGWYNQGVTVSIIAEPNEGFEFDSWEDGTDSNPFVFKVKDGRNVTKIAIFTKKAIIDQPEIGGEEVFFVCAEADDPEHGYITGLNDEGIYSPNAEVVLEAVATEGYRFDHWNDGSTNNPLTIYPSTDLLLVAYFVKDESTGLENTDGSTATVGNDSKRCQKPVKYIDPLTSTIRILMPDGSLYDTVGRRLK